MPQHHLDLYSDFAAHNRDFVLTADEEALEAIYPGRIVSPGDCLFPVYLRVKESFSAFEVRSGDGDKNSLCFSRIMFIGTVDGVEKLRNVSKFAICSQSSGLRNMEDAQAGVSENFYANNIHTEQEDAPWWRAEFPENIRVRHIYFYRRVDWAVIYEKNLRIVGETSAGEQKPLYSPEAGLEHREKVFNTIEKAVSSLFALRSQVTEGQQEEYDEQIGDALRSLLEYTAVKNQSSKGALAKLAAKLKPAKKRSETKLVSVPLVKRQAIADKMLDAVYMAVGGAKDFGSSIEYALNVSVRGLSASELRFRVFGEIPPGMAGAEVYVDGTSDPLRFGHEKLSFKYRPPGFGFPESYGIGLFTQVRSRVVKLGGLHAVDAVKVWNLSEQHAGNSFFIEISARTSSKDEWQVLYDHGAPYRHACNVLRLADYLLRSAWTPSYARLLGKIFTQYRRRRMMKPVAKLVRDKADLNKAVFEGAKVIPPQTRYAAPLVLGKHGLQVPVAYRPEKEVMAHLAEIRDKVRGTGHVPMFMYGTLLGAIREKGFIPHDDDLDLSVIVDGAGPEDLMAECERLIAVFNEAGIPCQPGSPIAPLIHCHRGPVTIDIFVLGHKDGKVYWPHTALKVVPERADIFLPAGTLEFKGETFDAPANPEAVCEARYGADWHIPNPAFEF